MKFLGQLLAALVVVFALNGQSQAALITLSTSDNPFDAGIDNQGWWSATMSNTDSNDNYFTGNVSSGVLNSFFSFDIPALVGEVVVGATLRLTRFSVNGDGPETLEFFDVSTDAAALNANVGNSAAIFNDLGSGTSYGTFDYNTTVGNITTIFDIMLNTSALIDINAAAGGFFSIGGSLITNDGNDFVFSGSGGLGFTQDLVLLTRAVTSGIPEPTSLSVFSAGLVGLVLMRRRRRRR